MKTKATTIGGAWNELAATIFGDEHTKIQRDEMRRAFYGGFHACLMMLEHQAGLEDEDASVSAVKVWHQEIREFASLIKDGKA